MTLESTLQKKLGERYHLDDPEAQTPRRPLQHNGWTVTFNTEAREALCSSFRDVIFQRDVQQDAGDPRAWAERIGRTVTGLLEPLKLMEVDAGQNIALLRSAAPTPNDPGLDYHEIELHGVNKAVVRRFRGFQEAGKKRAQIPFTLTYAALAKLIGGVTAEK
jgi:hypothetical protein